VVSFGSAAAMRSDVLLVCLTVVGSAVCWWPAFIYPRLDSIWWVSLAVPALCAGLSSVLSHRRWPLFLIASIMGNIEAQCVGNTIWGAREPMAGFFVAVAIVVTSIAVAVTSLLACLAGRKVSIPAGRPRLAVWVAVSAVVAFGPIARALTPPLVAYRVARNDEVAAERFSSLRSAAKQTVAESGDLQSICDGSSLRRHYVGPSFSNEDWRVIADNYVRQDGYTFIHQDGYSYMVYCREKAGGYTIAAFPARDQGDGTRQFCADESGRLGCRMEWNGSRFGCLPCKK
jgi:hypothetical protein